MEFLSGWIVSPSTLTFLCLIWGMPAQQTFRYEPRNLTVRMGATVELKCEVLRPSGTIQWVKDGFVLGPERNLPGFPRYSMTGKHKGQNNLRIENAQLQDESSYECQVGPSESSEALISDTAWLTVLIPPSKPYFIVNMATPWVAGKTYSITCVAPDAKPEAKIALFKDGVELTGAESSTMPGSKDKLQNTRTKVKVTAVSSDNGRELMCQAINPAIFKPVVSTMTMNVNYPPQPPVILGMSKDEVQAGKTLVVECESRGGNPLASLRWFKNGEMLSMTWEEDSASQKARSVLKLKITPEDNQAELCCESFNMVSVSPLSVTRKLTVFFEPAELTLSGSLEAIEGQELTLSCYAATSNPPVDIRWWLGYKELNTTVPYREEGEHGGMTTISNVTHHFSREENGLQLTCEAFNKGTHFSKTQGAEVSVYYSPHRVWIDAPTDPHNAGTTITLVCHSTGGNPTATLSWFKNGKAVSHAQKQTSSGMGVSRELVLVLTASDNLATYRCDATNKAKKTISAQTKLVVHFTAVSMKITSKQEVLHRGEMLDLECVSGSSNPKSNTSWSLGSFRFPGVEKAVKKDLFGGVAVTSTLSLKLSSQHHNKKVICHAYNPVVAEGSKTFYQLDVLYPPEFSPNQPREVRVEEDDMATIPLLVSANPEGDSCIWLHHRKTLVKGEDLRYLWLDDQSLKITNVTRKDAGVYNVECENEEGVNQTSIILDVLYGPSVKAERDPVFVNLGGVADLICVADANPIKSGMFNWKWLGEENVGKGEELQKDESSLLTIHNVTRAHAGFYQCTADNGIAFPVSVDVQLVVQFKPQILKGPQWTKVASRGDGTTIAELVCLCEGIPRVEFIWEKNGVLMDLANPRYEEKTKREGYFHSSTLQVVNVSSTLDFTVFSCTARNSLGEDKLDIQLVSTNHPDPPSSFALVSITHHSVTLEWIPGFDGGLTQRFRIRFRQAQSASFLYVDVFPPDATNFTVSGLQPATTYNFSLNALNSVGESDYADNNAILTITTKEVPWPEYNPPTAVAPVDSQEFPVLLTVLLAVFGGLFLLNSLGFYFGLKWKNRQSQTTGAEGISEVNGEKTEVDGSSQSSIGNTNKYESREKINTTAQRTLLIDSGSETDSNIYEGYATENHHYYYPMRDYKPYLGPHPEESRGLGNFENHLYEEVRDQGVYHNTVTSSILDYSLTPYKNDLRSTNFTQGTENTRQYMDVRQADGDSELPFELQGELV